MIGTSLNQYQVTTRIGAHGLAARYVGIIHRDLKPEIIFVTKGGRV